LLKLQAGGHNIFQIAIAVPLEFASMKGMRDSTHRPLTALAVAVFSLGALGAPWPALALDDQSTVTSVLGLVGVPTGESNEKIDYRERPKLVLPGNRQALPEPQARGDAPSSGWPVEQEVGSRRRGAAAARELAPESGSSVAAGDEPPRKLLTDPPRGYRHATKDLKATYDPKEKSGWTNPFAFIREQAGKVIGSE
jgi:hypothetical protein